MNEALNQLPHLQALGLEFNPFPVVPDAQNFFSTQDMSIAISDILHCIDARKGFILISGEVGLGKTTLSRLLLNKLAEKDVKTSLVLNSFLQGASLLKAINKDFEIQVNSDLIEDQLDALNTFLLDQHSKDKNCVIIIDDAQQLSIESLEIIRQLSNLETNQSKLVQIILVAQSEILNTLDKHEIRQLKSRIALNHKMQPLSLEEVKKFVRFRLARAGSSGEIDLTERAYKCLHEVSQGLPRQINLIMDRCMYVVAAYGINIIEKDLVQKAYQEIKLDVSTEKVKGKSTHLRLLALSLIAIVSIFLIQKSSLLSEFNDNFAPQKSDNIIKNSINKPESQSNNEPIFLAGYETDNGVSSSPEGSDDLKTYLQQFDMQHLTGAMESALKQNDFATLSETLKSQSNLKLILGQSNISHLDSQIFWFLKQNPSFEWMTLWEPNVEISDFFHDYRSQEIFELQSRLQEIGFYTSRLDGIVGEQTTQAVANFQSLLNLKVSGYPDLETLFLIEKTLEAKRMKESGAEGVVYVDENKESSEIISLSSQVTELESIN